MILIFDRDIIYGICPPEDQDAILIAILDIIEKSSIYNVKISVHQCRNAGCVHHVHTFIQHDGCTNGF